MLWSLDLVQRRQWWEFHKIPVTLPVRLKTFFYFRSWRGQMHREKLTWKHCKWKLIGSGKEGETVNLGPNGCKNKWICANGEVVSWLPKQIRYCKDMLGVDEEFDVCNFSCWHLDNFVNIFDKRINQVSEYILLRQNWLRSFTRSHEIDRPRQLGQREENLPQDLSSLFRAGFHLREAERVWRCPDQPFSNGNH